MDERYRYTPPVIDLDKVKDEKELLPLIKQILFSHDTFLLQNFASIDAVVQLVDLINAEPGSFPNDDAGSATFGSNFTGTINRGNHTLQQWMSVDGRDSPGNGSVSRDLTRLNLTMTKVALYFSELCLQALGIGSNVTVSPTSFSSVLCRHHSQFSEQLLDMQFDYSQTEWIDFESVGLLTIVPDAICAKVYRNDSWHSVDVEKCLLIHTGTLLADLSAGMHQTSKMRLSTRSIALSIQPTLSCTMPQGGSFADRLLEFNLNKFPEVGEEFYPAETRLLNLKRSVLFLKNLFATIESMINLYKINHPGIDYVELDSLLPGISRMIKEKVTTTDFQRLLYIWPNAYDIDINSKCGISFKLQTSLSLTKSRLLEFSEKIDQWVQSVQQSPEIPDNIPPMKLGKRKASNSSITYSAPLKNTNRRKIAPLKGSAKSANPLYLGNKDSGNTVSVTENVATSSLLDRIRDKERRAAALLSHRQSMQEHFITVKMKHIFNICFTLEPEIPYTEDYLTGLVVDSLTDTHNPIGRGECVIVLSKLNELLGQDVFQIITVEGDLKVYKWKKLDKAMMQSLL
ncbi:Tah11 [Kluyveromyces lactis]|nr:Tah11 [Kluyveromyces lactis]